MAYRITKHHRDKLMTAQRGRCFLCKRPADILNGDHDHETGRGRMLLCMSCNTGLGHFRDDPVVLRRAAKYVEYFRQPQEELSYLESERTEQELRRFSEPL